MKITVMTIIISGLSSIEIYRIVNKCKHSRIGIRSASMWIIMWGAIGVCSVCPSLLNYFVDISQMGNREFFILLISVLLLFALMFNISSRQEKNQRDIAKIVQELGILKSNACNDPSNKKNDKLSVK
jgi:hypothetical protein